MADRFVCTDASINRGEPVTATASQVRAWLMIEVHGAWGVNAVEESRLGQHLPPGWRKELSGRGIRAICIRPAVRAPEPHDVRVFFVIANRPGRTKGHIWTREIPLAAVQYLSSELPLGWSDSLTGESTDGSPDEWPEGSTATAPERSGPGEGWERHDEPVFAVCTNGRHDQCCANDGRPVVRHLATTRWAEHVWECSHIGGDRFAANLLIAPDSLYFGRMEPHEAERILDDYADGRLDLAHYRGRSTLTYLEQAAEHGLRARLGLDVIDAVRIESIPNSNRVLARVGDPESIDVASYEVTMRREMLMSVEPLTCRGAPNQRVARFSIEAIHRLD